MIVAAEKPYSHCMGGWLLMLACGVERLSGGGGAVTFAVTPKLCTTPRWAMQTLGSEWGRQCISDDFWTNLLVDRINEIASNVVVVVTSRNRGARKRSNTIPHLELSSAYLHELRRSQRHWDQIFRRQPSAARSRGTIPPAPPYWTAPRGVAKKADIDAYVAARIAGRDGSR
jgi:hypothetical protein